MKINFSQVFKGKTVPESSLYMIYGKPYHLITEARHRIRSLCSHNKDSQTKVYFVDADFKIEELRSDLESLSLFNDSMIISLNVLSPSIPKNLQDYLLSVNLPESHKLILSKPDSNTSFRKTKFFKIISEKYCLVDIVPLKNQELITWIKMRLTNNKINFSEQDIDLLIRKNEGDTASLSQEIYKMTLSKKNKLNEILNNIDNSYIYNEFDLIDNLLLFDREKSLIVLDYLKKINLPEPYLLAILYNEIKKIFFLKNNLEPKPYIPYNKSDLYQTISSKLNSQKIKKMMKYCYKIDKSIKSSSNHDYVWNQFECIIHSFN